MKKVVNIGLAFFAAGACVFGGVKAKQASDHYALAQRIETEGAARDPSATPSKADYHKLAQELQFIADNKRDTAAIDFGLAAVAAVGIGAVSFIGRKGPQPRS